MEWKAKYTPTTPKPNDVRFKRVFAWLPKQVGGNVVFLEYYEVLQAYLEQAVQLRIEGKDAMFTVGKWTEISQRTIPNTQR